MMMTPRCTTMPPLARPTRPRSPGGGWPARAGAGPSRRRSRPSPKASSDPTPRAPSSAATSREATPIQAGQSSRWRSSSPDALRHGSTGAIAISVSRARPSGSVIRSKNGGPTEICWSRSASTISGKTVPSSTTKANTANSTLLARNAPSREIGESMVPGERSRSPRQPIRPIDTATTSPKNVSSQGPIADSVKRGRCRARRSG